MLRAYRVLLRVFPASFHERLVFLQRPGFPAARVEDADTDAWPIEGTLVMLARKAANL